MVILIRLFALLVLTSCLTREEIDAALWNSDRIPVEYCEKYPEIKEYGFYRKLNDGNEEFVSFCSDNAKTYFAMYNKDFEKLVTKAQLKKRK